MNALTQIFNEIEKGTDNSIKKSNKATLYTLVNYLEAKHGMTQLEMDRNFNKGNFTSVFESLLKNHVIEQTDSGLYQLSTAIRTQVSPLLRELTTIAYTSPTGQSKSKDPVLGLLYNCRSEIFSS